MSVKKCFAAVAVSMCLVVAAGRGADLFVGSAQGRAGSASRRCAERRQDHSGEGIRCGKCRRTRLPRSTRSRPAPAGPSNARPAMPYSARSGSSSSSPAAPPARAWSSTIVRGRQTFMKMLQVQGGLGFRCEPESSDLRLYQRAGAEATSSTRAGSSGARLNLSAMAGGQGRMFSGAAAVSPGVYLVPADADRPFGNAHRRRHEILQGRRSELTQVAVDGHDHEDRTRR